ncbi:c-type cytochrome [Aurantiacibacter poecillastricola]|uniref:c-type cytochrome n=1 Tax=Aurantiacibacter poecillastricola TaxID=3064385 RepID=UPI00273D5E11|nr:c-type cytochrome [Aurantiacibacter sp. 219JJ12-13]MDP5262863.1 c-type cytochrome [Aurantiacibacter sp. 219JJ12-13]
MKTPWTLAILAAVLSACQTVEPEPIAEADPEDRALAQAACGGCHSVEAYGLSPNSDAPEFPAIANRRNLTRETLTTWLVDAHNYPEEMDFYLEDDEVQQLVDYILTLRRVDYHPPY